MLLQIVFPRPLQGPGRLPGRLFAALRGGQVLSWLGLGALYEVVLVAALGTLVFYWRLLGLEQIEIGGDALKVWEFARQLAHGAELPSEFNHHIARFGMVVPVLVAQLLLGSDAWVYYAAPLAASVVLHLSVYGVARKISGRFGGILAVVLLLGFGEMVRPSSQILPELFGPAYVCAAYLAALFYTDATGRRAQIFWLALTALLLFGAYGSKISYLYYAPGAALLVWRGRRALVARAASQMTPTAGAVTAVGEGATMGVAGAAPALETNDARTVSATGTEGSEARPDRLAEESGPSAGAARGKSDGAEQAAHQGSPGRLLLRLPGGLRWVSLRVRRWIEARGLKDAVLLTAMVVACIAAEVLFYLAFTRHTSQLDVINETHGVSRGAQVKQLAGFFAMYQRAGVEWHKWLTLGFLSMLGLMATARDRRATLVVVSLLVYFFLHTFILRKLNPPIPWTNPHPRYLLAVAAPLMIVIGAFVHEAGARVAAKIAFLRRWPLLSGTLSMALGLTVLLSTVSELQADWAKSWNRRHALQTTRHTQKVLTEAFAQGIPIVTKVRSGKPLRAAGSLYIDPELMKVDGELKPYRAFQARASKTLLYLAPEIGRRAGKRKPLDQEVVRRARKRKCVIELSQRYRFLTGRMTVPRGCEPLVSPAKT